MNREKLYRILFAHVLFVGLALPFLSCEKQLLAPDPPAEPENVFEYLWEDVHKRYALFEVKGIDWVAVGDTFRARVHPGMGDQALFNVLSDMLYELRDGHVNLTSSFDRSRNWEWFQGHLPNYNQHIIESKYLGTNFRITGPLLNQVIDSVLYVNYRSFGDELTQDHLDQLMQRAEGLKGVIIDIRHNGGGSLQTANRLAACFANQTYVYAHDRIKTGPGFEDFSHWRPLSVAPRQGKRFEGSVVVLVNRRSYSASSFFAQMMRVMPHAVLIGDQTGGGGGIPVFGELPNGWKYRFSSTQTLTPDGEHIETGVPVDIRRNMESIDELHGIDSILETALDWLR
jgi:hypothetical protein